MANEKELRESLMKEGGALPTSSWRRLWRTGKSALGVGGALLRGQRGEALDSEAVAGIVRELGQLRGIAMKAGQMLGYINASVPEELRAMMALLQTAAPVVPFDRIAAVVREALGERAATLLAGMEAKPIAVASIAQVHRGRLPDGTEVAIKVRHPGIEQALEADFRSAQVPRAMAALIGASGVRDMIDEARTAFLEECDFSLEAARQEKFASLFAGDPVIVVPPVEREWCARTVLVTRWTPGRSFDEFLAGSPSQAARNTAGEALFRFWMRTLYHDGLFHGDPHPGNFAFTDDAKNEKGVIVYDFGCVREFDSRLRMGFTKLAAATRADDLGGMCAALDALGGKAPRDEKGRQQLRRLLRGFFGPLSEPGARRITLDEGMDARQMMSDKRAIARLQLPGRMLFLFRLRFGLYAVLARLGAELDWSRLEAGWAQQPPPSTSGATSTVISTDGAFGSSVLMPTELPPAPSA